MADQDGQGVRARQSGGWGRLGWLLAVNSGLIGAIAWQGLASGQPEGERRRPDGRYTMVSGAFFGSQADAVFIVDATNREMAAVRWDPSSRSVRLAGYRDLARDADERPGR